MLIMITHDSTEARRWLSLRPAEPHCSQIVFDNYRECMVMLEALKFYLSVVNFETGIDPSLFLIFDDF